MRGARGGRWRWGGAVLLLMGVGWFVDAVVLVWRCGGSEVRGGLAGREALWTARRGSACGAAVDLLLTATVHVSVRMGKGVRNLRKLPCLRVIEKAFYAAQGRFGLRLNHFSVQSNHLHLIVETTDQVALSRALKGLG